MTDLVPRSATAGVAALPHLIPRRPLTERSSAEKLAWLRSTALSESSLAPGRIEFRSRRGETMTRTVFDEEVGAVVVTEHVHADRTVVVEREYVLTAAGHMLSRRETVVKGAAGTRTYVEIFDVAAEANR